MGQPNKITMMSSRNEQQARLGIDNSSKELRLLSELETDPEVTQRQLSNRLGVALGLTNLMLRNLGQKGYIKTVESTWKRRLYTLTPRGFSYRIKLMVAYFHRVLDNYQEVRKSLREHLEPLALNSESHVAIVGTREFAELVFLGLKELGIEEMDFFDADPDGERKFLGMPIHDIKSLQPNRYDRVVLALLGGWEEPLEDLKSRGIPEECLVTFFADGTAKEKS